MARKAAEPAEAPFPVGERTSLYRWYVLALLAICYAVHVMDRTIINLLLEPIKHEFHLSDSNLGLMTGLGYAVPFAIMGLPLGALADRVRRGRLLAVLVTAWSLCTALGGVARGYGMLLASRMAVGAMESGTPPTALALVSDFFPPRIRASAVSIFYVGAPLGAVLGAQVAGHVASAYGWRATLFAASAPGLLVALLLWLTVRDPGRGVAEGTAPDATPSAASPPFTAVFALIARKPALALILLALVLSAMSTVGISSWAPSVLARSHHLPVKAVGAYMALTGLVGMGGTLLGGFFSDVICRGRSRGLLVVAGLANLLQAWPLYMALSSPTVAGFEGPFLAWTVLHTVYYGAGFGLALGLAPAQMRGRLMAVTFVLSNVLGAGLGPQIIGWVSDHLQALHDPDALPHAVAVLIAATAAAGLAFLAAIPATPKGATKALV